MLFRSGEFHGQRSLAGYSPWGCKELDTTEQLTNSQQNQAETGVWPEISHLLCFFPFPFLFPAACHCFFFFFPLGEFLKKPLVHKLSSQCLLLKGLPHEDTCAQPGKQAWLCRTALVLHSPFEFISWFPRLGLRVWNGVGRSQMVNIWGIAGYI